MFFSFPPRKITHPAYLSESTSGGGAWFPEGVRNNGDQFVKVPRRVCCGRLKGAFHAIRASTPISSSARAENRKAEPSVFFFDLLRQVVLLADLLEKQELAFEPYQMIILGLRDAFQQFARHVVRDFDRQRDRFVQAWNRRRFQGVIEFELLGHVLSDVHLLEPLHVGHAVQVEDAFDQFVGVLHFKNREESIGEMKHADELIERILDLDGVPNMQRLEKVHVGENVPEQLKLDHALEAAAIPRLNKAIALAVEVADNVTRELLEGIAKSENDHLVWLESQLLLLKQVGEQNYLAQQIKKED